jgi:hypothetical protein
MWPFGLDCELDVESPSICCHVTMWLASDDNDLTTLPPRHNQDHNSHNTMPLRRLVTTVGFSSTSIPTTTTTMLLRRHATTPLANDDDKQLSTIKYIYLHIACILNK